MTPDKASSYSIPFEFILRVSLSALFGHKRSFREDALKLASRFNPPIQVIGEQNIPGQENYIITANHFARPAFNAWWIALAISAAVEQDIHWIMPGAWAVDGKWHSAGQRLLTRWAFSRLAKIYGFSITPPVAARPGDETMRAESVQKVFVQARDKQLTAIGYLPEGRDFAGGRLGWPPYGTGRFVHHLNQMGYRILPVGIYEENGQLQIHFGVPYDLGEFHSHSSGEVDPITFRLLTQRQIDMLLTRTVMRRIAILLPERQRGEFD